MATLHVINGGQTLLTMSVSEARERGLQGWADFWRGLAQTVGPAADLRVEIRGSED